VDSNEIHYFLVKTVFSGNEIAASNFNAIKLKGIGNSVV